MNHAEELHRRIQARRGRGCSLGRADALRGRLSVAGDTLKMMYLLVRNRAAKDTRLRVQGTVTIQKPMLGPPIHDDLVQRVFTADALRMAIVHWIERTSRRRRRQRRLGKLTPIELETMMKDAVTLVA